MGGTRRYRRLSHASIDRLRAGSEKTRAVEAGARRSRGIEMGFRQRRPATADELGPSRDRYQMSPTKRCPWKVRERNRRRNTVARASRKANR